MNDFGPDFLSEAERAALLSAINPLESSSVKMSPLVIHCHPPSSGPMASQLRSQYCLCIVIALNPRILWSVLWAEEHVSTGVKASKVLRFHFIWILVVSSNNRNPLLTMDLVAIVCLIQIIFEMSRIHFKLSWYLWGSALCVSMRFYEVF